MKYFYATFLVMLSLLLLGSAVTAHAEMQPVQASEYLAYAINASEDFYQHFDEDLAAWKERIQALESTFPNAPSNHVSMAAVNAYLYQATGEQKYADRSRRYLVEIGDYLKFYDLKKLAQQRQFKNVIPPVGNLFVTPNYIKAFLVMRDTGQLTAKDKKTIINNIAVSCDWAIDWQEWGAMNRGILRGETFYLAWLAAPNHPSAQKWKMVAETTLKDCWGTWEIEDAAHYNAIYLYSLFSVIEYTDEASIFNEKAFFNEAVTRYSMQFYTRLFAPCGMVPDFGDAYMFSNWQRWALIFEKGAAMYHDPEIKYAATRLVRTQWQFTPEKRHSSHLAQIAMDCYRNADFELHPVEPPQKSEIVLDDLVGKKIVFRDGYEPNDTYMLVNFKDEGDAGFLSREHLRWSIPVEEEKMTHGHSDENDITMLMSGGNILLHDGGYREYMPSGIFGAFRADYFHNRTVIRKEKMFLGQKAGEERYGHQNPVPGQSLIDFVRNSGGYQPTHTELIDFLSTPDFDYSRTRLTQPKRDYQYDRIVTWIKPLNVFVVFDVVKFLEDDYYTLANFWHTRKILAQGDNYFVTQYDSLRNKEFPTDKALLTYFPQGTDGGRLVGTDPERRYWQNEIAIHQSLSGHYHAGTTRHFVTVLAPIDANNQHPEKLLENIQLLKVDKDPQA
ncbi:hypothetical protein KAH55_12545, partial [bacterium]|nr:hypothetical protein [bacterium]